jgi:4'-phosphopantetheinyl transferase
MWFARVTPDLARSAVGLLPEEATDELDGFQEPEQSRRAVQLALRRSVLAHCLGIPPSSIAVSARRRGPIESPSPNLKLSASHHDDITVLALCEQASSIGVDIEPVFEPAWDDAIDEVLTENELASLKELPAESQPRAYFTCWTLKEAAMKALGEGLDQRSPASIEVSVPPAPAALLSIDGAPPKGRWSMRTVQLEGNICSLAALAVGPIACRARHWPVDLDPAISYSVG